MSIPGGTAPPLSSQISLSQPVFSLLGRLFPESLRRIISRTIPSLFGASQPVPLAPEISHSDRPQSYISQLKASPLEVTSSEPSTGPSQRPEESPVQKSLSPEISVTSPLRNALPRAEVRSPPVPWKPQIDDPRIVVKKFGSEVRIDDDGAILKRGNRVGPAEEAALRIVKQYTTIPVPEVYSSDFTCDDDHPWGKIWMEHLPGSPLSETWDALEDGAKERICNELWGFVKQLRNIPKPREFEHFYQCGADGSVSQDVLLENMGFPVPILDDESLRNRINERYRHFGGDSYRENLLDYLPRSDASVFTHADIAPRNVLVDEAGAITGLIDWEFAGWYPDYWEYAKTQLQWGLQDFMYWMDRTKPQHWDLDGIHRAARILF